MGCQDSKKPFWMYLLLSHNYCFVTDALHLETTFLIKINFLDSRPVVQFHLGSTAALNKALIFCYVKFSDIYLRLSLVFQWSCDFNKIQIRITYHVSRVTLLAIFLKKLQFRYSRLCFGTETVSWVLLVRIDVKDRHIDWNLTKKLFKCYDVPAKFIACWWNLFDICSITALQKCFVYGLRHFLSNDFGKELA